MPSYKNKCTLKTRKCVSGSSISQDMQLMLAKYIILNNYDLWVQVKLKTPSDQQFFLMLTYKCFAYSVAVTVLNLQFSS